MSNVKKLNDFLFENDNNIFKEYDEKKKNQAEKYFEENVKKFLNEKENISTIYREY